MSTNDWISVDESLPPEDTSVLVFTVEGGRHIAFIMNGKWIFFDVEQYFTVTHWQPLPDKPVLENAVE